MSVDPHDYLARAVALVTLAQHDQWDDIETMLHEFEAADFPFLTVALLGFASASYSEAQVRNLGLQIAEAGGAI